MDEASLRNLLAALESGEVSRDEVVDKLRIMPISDLGYARFDGHRALRRGFPEVVLGQGKTSAQLVGILGHAISVHSTVLCTRVEAPVAAEVLDALDSADDLQFHSDANCLVYGLERARPRGRGPVLVVAAGTSDLHVAREAELTARVMGNDVSLIADVGVAGLHRVLSVLEPLRQAAVVIVVAGMEGALPSVVAGLVDAPVIAVPTSVGYGASLGGVAALLGMLNSCSPGITVVNIDNGFGAGYAAALMNRKNDHRRQPDEMPDE